MEVVLSTALLPSTHPSQTPPPPPTLLARRSARSSAPIILDANLHHIPRSSGMATSISTTATTIHHSLSVPSVMTLSLTPATISSTHPHSVLPSTSSQLLRPTPRRSFTHPSPGQSSAGAGSLPFIPLTPIMASPSLTPEPGSEPRESKDVGVAGAGLGGARNDDYIGARRVVAKDEADGAVLSRSSGGRHEAASILYVPPHAECYCRSGADVVKGTPDGAGLNALSDIQDEASTISHSSLPLGLSPAVLKGANATPLWTSTPPTPPQIPESLQDTISPTHDCNAPLGSHVCLALSGRRRRMSHPRPASVSLFPPPSSTLASSSHSTISRSRSAATRRIMSSASRDVKRRQSLPPNFGKPLPPLPPTTALCSISVSPSRTSDSNPHSRLTSSASSSQSAASPSRSRSRSKTRRGLDLDRPQPDDGMMLPPSLSRSTDKPKSIVLVEGVKVRDPRQVKSDDGHDLSLETSGSMTSFKTAKTSPSSPTSPGSQSVRSNKKVFHLEGSVSEGEEGEEEEVFRGRKVEREIAANVEEVKRLKRFHALVELLRTEVGYLMDLRALVTIYLAQLSNFTVSVPPPSPAKPSPSSLSISSLGLTRSFPSSRSSFIAIPQASGATSGLGPPILAPDLFSSAPARSDADALRESGKLHPDAYKEPKKQDTRRPALADSDIQLISRNAEELLKLHEVFVVELREAVAPLGFDTIFARADENLPPGDEVDIDYPLASRTVDQAVGATAEVFAQQSSLFGIYEHFCPKHSEAADVVRSAQDQYAVEWDAYEQRCSLLVSHAFELSAQRLLRKSREDTDSVDGIATPDSTRRSRRHSTPVLSSSPGPGSSATSPAANVTGYPESRKRKRSGLDLTVLPSQVGRLKFLDYMIKPIQRICKYPLLLDQLKSTADGGILLDVERACSAMRSVVSLVDDASMKQAHSVKSALIVSRIAPSLPIQAPRSASPSSPATPSPSEERPGPLTADFLSSLGACLLGGALDIVQHPSSRARYLGAFLYVGGYMVMVKITKGGKVYEPKYWFSLAGFDLIDDETDDMAFPYSFHLCGHGHFLQFAAACQVEKDIWLAAIQDATSTAPEWKNEPQSSLPDAGLATSPTEEEHHEYSATPLPTIQSLSELEGSDAVVPPSIAKAQSRPFKTMPRMDGCPLRYDGQTSSNVALSRRSSTASVKAFFAPLTFDISTRITRPSSQVRQQVDHALHDVFSDNCLTVRSQALMREEELFQVRKKTSAAMTRSNSGLSITSAMKRRYDSVIVSSRRRGSLDGHGIEPVSDSENYKTAQVIIPRRTKTTSTKRRHHPSLSLIPTEVDVLAEVDTPTLSPDGLPDSPSPLSNCSSATSSNVGSIVPSPLDPSIPLPLPPTGPHRQSETTLHTRTHDYRPKRTRSMVDNVRCFFHSRSLSPTPPSAGHLSPKSAAQTLEPEINSITQWWRRGSLRRRAQSSPDVPTDESSSPCTTPAYSSDDHHATNVTQDPHASVYSSHPDTGASQTPHSVPPTPRRVAFKDSMPYRRRSLYVSSRLDVKPPSRSDSVPSTPRKTLKSVLFFRTSSFTPLDSH